MANETMGLLGRKLGMTQLFENDGKVQPVTVIEAGPCRVVRTKTEDARDGYNAIQLAFGHKKASRATKADLGHLKGANVDHGVTELREFRVAKDVAEGTEIGSDLKVAEIFEAGQDVDVCGTSKGRGFAGVMKRHNFSGFERTHGVHEFFRHGGSIGTRLTPGMTLKGTRMGGHMGSERVTVQNLKVIRVDAERNLIFVRGGVPGPNGGLVTVRKAVKRQG